MVGLVQLTFVLLQSFKSPSKCESAQESRTGSYHNYDGQLSVLSRRPIEFSQEGLFRAYCYTLLT